MKRLTPILILFLGIGMAHAQSKKAEGYFNESEVHMILLEDNKAIEKLDLAIKEDNGYADAYYRRGVCYYRLRKNDLAEKDFLLVTKLDKENAKVYYNLALINEHKNDHKKAESYYKKIHLINKYTAEGLAEELIKEADVTYQDYMKDKDPSASTTVDSKEIKETFKMLEKAILIDPLEPDHLFTLALYQKHRRKYSEAIDTYKKLLNFNANEVDQADVHVQMGNIYDLKKELDTRDEYFRKALSLDPNQAASINLVFMSHLSNVLPEDQLEFAQRWNSLLPKEYLPKLILGSYYADNNENQKAIDLYNQAIEINSDYTEGYIYRSKAYYGFAYQENNIEHLYKAYDDISAAIEKEAKTVDNYYQRGKILFTVFAADYDENKIVEKEMAKAILEDIDAIIALDDTYAHAYQLRASVNYILNGEKDTADVLSDKALHEKYCPGKH